MTNIPEVKLGIIAVSLREDDQLIDVKVTNDSTELMLITKKGAAVRFRESDVRATGRASMGVIGIDLDEDDDSNDDGQGKGI